MNKDEINRYIHVEIMGNCPHDKQTRIEYPPIRPNSKSSGWDMKCDACGTVSVTIRNYCSDESPRRLLNEVESRVLETVPYVDYIAVLTRLCPYQGFNAKALQRATACVNAHKAMENENG